MRKSRRRLVLHPNQILRKQSTPVKNFDQNLQTLIRDMKDIMKQNKGLGLAAPQVSVNKRVIVLDIPKHAYSQVLINPKIVSHSKDTVEMMEGCLSFPGIFKKVDRYREVKIVYQDSRGKTCYYTSQTELISQCLQHEIEHLDGVLFIDHPSVEGKDQPQSPDIEVRYY